MVDCTLTQGVAMILQNTTELRIVGIYDRGVPNQERIVLKVNELLNLAQYGILIAFQIAPEGPATPYNDQFIWLTERIIKEGTVIFIYTGPGEFRETVVLGTDIPALVMHWGKQYTIFANSNVVPILCRIDALHIAELSYNLPQSDKLEIVSNE